MTGPNLSRARSHAAEDQGTGTRERNRDQGNPPDLTIHPTTTTSTRDPQTMDGEICEHGETGPRRVSCDAICDAAAGGSCFTPWCKCRCHKLDPCTGPVRPVVSSYAQSGLTFDEFRATNAARCRRWHEGFPEADTWSLADWSNAVCGEAGELANVIKKIRRHETGHRPGANDPSLDELHST